MQKSDYIKLLERLKLLDSQDSFKVELSHYDIRIFISLLKQEIEELEILDG